MNPPLFTDKGAGTLHHVVRIFFALIAILYFYMAPAFVMAIANWLPWLVVIGYAAGHIAIMVAPLARKNLFAIALDMLVLGLLVVLDGGNPPPMMALVFIAALSNGLMYGLQRFLIALAAGLLVLAVALPIRFGLATEPNVAASLFLLFALTACMLFFALIIWRNQRLTLATLEATWRDPETGFISRNALISTAGWLVPLHDRISSPLTLVLVTHEQLGLLADHVAKRIRRSDVAARYDEHHLALLLPCTATAAAEQLLSDLQDRHNGLRAAVMTLLDSKESLEQHLQSLLSAMSRTDTSEDRWLAYASKRV